MLYFDGLYLPVRLARRVVRVPVLVALGVREDGQKLLIALQFVAGETTAAWAALIAELARRAYAAFVRKWTPLCAAVVRSLEEAGDELLTYYRFPRSQWKCLRTTNPLERLNEEFRRRTKTQGSFRDETSALVLLWGLVAFGQIGLRKIDGWKDMTQALKIAWKEAA